MLYPTLHAPNCAQGMEEEEEVLNAEFEMETTFFVDELLDFSNGCSELEEKTPPLPEEDDGERGEKGICSENGPVSGDLSGKEEEEFGTLHESELNVEAEGLESLEWLSHFVEDSYSDYSLTGKLPTEPLPPVVEQPCFMTPIQTKARTKRGRTGVRVWPVLSHSPVESSTSSSSSTSEPEPGKKRKRKVADGGGVAAQPRKCSHCGVTKTPQWRAGPLGSKTLCNACGVRFKSGRLLPEYRPACSPTYSSDLHSNNHRKVLEMRRKKETEVPPVQSF